jgi:hypothetical protein
MTNKKDIDYELYGKGFNGQLTIEEIERLPEQYDEFKPAFKEWYYFMNRERPKATKKEVVKKKLHLISTLTSLASDSERIKEAERKVFIQDMLSFEDEKPIENKKPTFWRRLKKRMRRIVKWFVAIRIVKHL